MTSRRSRNFLHEYEVVSISGMERVPYEVETVRGRDYHEAAAEVADHLRWYALDGDNGLPDWEDRKITLTMPEFPGYEPVTLTAGSVIPENAR